MMDATEILDSKITEILESRDEAQQALGALHVLVRLALAEAESAGAKDAVKTLKMADNLIIRGHISSGTFTGDIVFGGE